jgi:integrase
MPTVNLTARFVANAPVPTSGRVEYFDKLTPGLALRITPNGARSWSLLYRHAGRKRRLTLGTPEKITLADARDLAADALKLVAKGKDPAKAKRDARAPGTVADMVDEFHKRYLKQLRSGAETKRLLDREVVRKWGTASVKEIERGDLIALLDKISDRGSPYTANRTLAAVRKLWGWAIERGIADTSPAVNVRPPAVEVKRDRVLSDSELLEVWHAAEDLGQPFKAFVRLLILTAQRRSEVAQLRPCDLDDLKAPTLWTLPREMTKADRLHTVPITPMAAAEIAALPLNATDEWAISSTGGDTRVSGYSKAKARLDKAIARRRKVIYEELHPSTEHGGARRGSSRQVGDLKEDGRFTSDTAAITGKSERAVQRDAERGEKIAPMGPWSFHDLRRSTASGIAKLGFPPHVVSALLNHSPSGQHGVTAIYLRHDYGAEKREALEAWATHIATLLAVQQQEPVGLPQ